MKDEEVAVGQSSTHSDMDLPQSEPGGSRSTCQTWCRWKGGVSNAAYSLRNGWPKT